MFTLWNGFEMIFQRDGPSLAANVCLCSVQLFIGKHNLLLFVGTRSCDHWWDRLTAQPTHHWLWKCCVSSNSSSASGSDRCNACVPKQAANDDESEWDRRRTKVFKLLEVYIIPRTGKSYSTACFEQIEDELRYQTLKIVDACHPYTPNLVKLFERWVIYTPIHPYLYFYWVHAQ